MQSPFFFCSKKEALHVCSHKVSLDDSCCISSGCWNDQCLCIRDMHAKNKPLALLDSACCWNGVYRTPDQLSSILVVWKTQADQNLKLFLFLKQNAPYLWLVRS